MVNYFDNHKPKYHPECVHLAALLIVEKFHRANYFKDKDEDKKTILVFVPGYAEIFELMQEIVDICPDEETKKQLILLALHSTIPEYNIIIILIVKNKVEFLIRAQKNAEKLLLALILPKVLLQFLIFLA